MTEILESTEVEDQKTSVNKTRLDPWKEMNLGDTKLKKDFLETFKQYNKQIGGALGILEEQPQDIQGRDREIEMLYKILERPKTPIGILIGQAGVGKTALVEEFAKQLNSGNYQTKLKHRYMLLALRLGKLSALGNARLQSELSTILPTLKTLETVAQGALKDPNIRFVLFIDEVHMMVTIFGPGTKVGGDVMKDILARSPIRVIAATTRREYDSTIATDQPFAERFKQIEMHELPKNIVEKICLNWWEKVAPELPSLNMDLIRKIIDANAIYRSDRAEPRKTIDILEDLVAFSRIYGREPDEHAVNQIFKDRYSINLSFNVSADDVYAEIERRIKGQPYAKYTLRRAFRAMVYQINPNSNRPRGCYLFTGPTGVGKSETVKAIAHSLYPGEKVLLNINMPDYKTPDHEPAFRKRLGETVRHVPNSIVLLDELEKAHPTVLDSLLAILDEGVVTFESVNRENLPEVNQVSLRNTIVIATTNAGTEVFNNDALFSQRDINDSNDLNNAEIQQLLTTLKKHLQAGIFKAELLGRFNRIIPYRSLSEAELLKIAEAKIENLVKEFKTFREIDIHLNEPRQWPKDLYDYYTTDVALDIAMVRATSVDPSSGGARAIAREIETNLYDEIIDAIVDNPGCSQFKLEVSKDSRIYTPSADKSEKGVIVNAIIKETNDSNSDDTDADIA